MNIFSTIGIFSILVLSVITNALALPSARAAVLIGNTEGDNIVEFDEDTGAFIGEFVSPFSGFESPDTLVYGPDENLYVSSGTTLDNSAIYRFDAQTGKLIDRFASGGGLFRPYGLTFGPDNLLYVSSFRSDEILRYDAQTGNFVDVFAQRDGTASGLNGPNGLLFGPDGKLYVTTQGSVADDEGNLEFAFPSQVLRYDVDSVKGEVFVSQPEPFPESFGFVSFLGLAVGPQDGDLYVSDFANGIRRYDFATGDELAVLDTNYTGTDPSGNFVGSLAFGPDDDLYTVGFDTETAVGSLLKFDVAEGDRTTVLDNSPQLERPIGLLFRRSDEGLEEAVDVSEPGMLASFAVVGLIGLGYRKKKSATTDLR